MCHSFDGFWLIIFDGNYTSGIRKKTKNKPQAFDDPVALRAHQLVITGDIGLTFRAVCDHIVDLLRIARGKLYVCWKACTSESDDPGPFNGIENLWPGKDRCISIDADPGGRVKQSVISDDDAGGSSAGYGVALFNSLYRTGAGADNIRRDKAVCFCDQLSGKYSVALFHDGLCRLADVLVYRKYKIS